MTEDTEIELRASRKKALGLLAYGALVPVGFSILHIFDWPDRSIRFAGLLVALAFAAYFVLFAMALLLRRDAVFRANAERISMPMGSSALVDIAWDEVEAYGLITRRIPWGFGWTSRVMGVRLHEDARKDPRFTAAYQREMQLNRAAMDADVVLTRWFVRGDFERALAAMRHFRPDLESPEMAEAAASGTDAAR